MTEVMKLKRKYDRKNPDLIQDVMDPASLEARREARRMEARKKEMALLRAEYQRKWAAHNQAAEAKREARERKRRREDIIEAVCLSVVTVCACICMVVLGVTGGL